MFCGFVYRWHSFEEDDVRGSGVICIDMKLPYSSNRLGAGEHGTVVVDADLDAVIVTMTVRGVWAGRLPHDAYLTAKRCLSGHPSALIIDLLGLTDPSAASVDAWNAVQRTGSRMDPPVQALMCLPEGAALADRLRCLSFRPMRTFAAPAAARAAAVSRLPPAERFSLRLTPTLEAPVLARNLVTDACAAWNLPELVHPGRIVISELVVNAAQHARTLITVLVSRRAAGLHMVVGDGDPRMPRLLEPRPASAGSLYPASGQGLRVVDAAATWGSLPSGDGKVVWATLYAKDR